MTHLDFGRDAAVLSDSPLLEHAIQHGSRNAQNAIPALVPGLGGAEVNHAWFVLKQPGYCIFTNLQERRHFCDGEKLIFHWLDPNLGNYTSQLGRRGTAGKHKFLILGSRKDAC